MRMAKNYIISICNLLNIASLLNEILAFTNEFHLASSIAQITIAETGVGEPYFSQLRAEIEAQMLNLGV